MSRAKVVADRVSNKTVGLGRKVTVASNEISHLYHVVGEWEANKALLGKKVGDKVEVEAPAGMVLYTIKKIH